jgi:hypothetical protein
VAPPVHPGGWSRRVTWPARIGTLGGVSQGGDGEPPGRGRDAAGGATAAVSIRF